MTLFFLGFLSITPAYAVKTTGTNSYLISIKDHPRLRGENQIDFIKLVAYRGSPPPTRGKHSDARYEGISGRITPAYAGKTNSIGASGDDGEDHPRLRGENPVRRLSPCLKIGSPTPTRGKLCGRIFSGWTYRITPAYAGKTFYVFLLIFLKKDHPRLRGENL